MIEKCREILRGPSGKLIAAGIVLAGLAFMFGGARELFGVSEGARGMNDRPFVCAETGKPFTYHLVMGDSVPVMSPHSEKSTGYPAVLCYWTADGKIKPEPTSVLMNEYAVKPGQTFCPDCNRLVLLDSPVPLEGMTPPPMASELKHRR